MFIAVKEVRGVFTYFQVCLHACSESFHVLLRNSAAVTAKRRSSAGAMRSS